MNTVWKVLTRKKVLDPVSTEQSELGRVLNTLDLTALGVGSTLGVGVYVLAGHVAKDTAGPSVILSFLIATVASVFAGLCYAEFGARAPRAGSAYIYSYVCVGEFIAFVIGWNLILEYVIGSASVARGLSLYLDTLVNNTLKDTFIDIAPLGDVSFISKYFDFFAFGVSMLLAVALAFGLKESTLVNNIFTFVNLIVVGFVIIAGSIHADSGNWKIPGNATNSTIGEGGFFPFGVEGMIKGAATCFYGFVGFDCIATTGEEVKNPKRAIPVAIVASLFVIFLAYFGTSTVVTLMLPYYEQDPNAPLPHAFASVGMEWAKWVVAIGGIFGLCASLFGAMFPLPRIIYAMASDNIIFRFLGRVSTRFKTPVVGTLLAGLLTGLMAALFELKQLVNMMSIGTLLAYTIVAASVLLLRYQASTGVIYTPLLGSISDSEDNETYSENRGLDIGESNEEVELIDDDNGSSSVLKQIFNCGGHQTPSEITEKIVKVEVCLYCVLCVGIGLCAMRLKTQIRDGEIWAIVITAVIVALAVLVLMSMVTQPKSRKELSFKVPLVPLIPALSILINIYLMLMLDPNTWIRFGVWMAVGLPTYYFSVKTHTDVRNESISSRSSIAKKGKLNGFANIAFDAEEVKSEPKKRPAPQPPTSPTAVIADLDEILETAEANLNDRKFSADSSNSNILLKENIQADVHCSDVQPKDVPLSTCDSVTSSNPDPVSSNVADSPTVAPGEEKIVAVEVQEPIPTILITEEKQLSAEEIPEEIQTVENEEKHLSAEEKQPVENEEKQVRDEDSPKETQITESQESEKNRNGTPIPEGKTETDGVAPQLAAIPTPPPFLIKMEDTSNEHIPRPIFTASDFMKLKLKPLEIKKPVTPPVDYSRQNSVMSPTDSNIKFGTPQYKEFREILGHQLQEGYAPLPPLDLKKKPVAQSTGALVNENVITDHIDRELVKEKFTQFLERTNSLPSEAIINKTNKIKENPLIKIDSNEEKKMPNGNSADDQEQHRQNIFKRKDDKNSGMEKPQNIPEADYKEQHRENMQHIFRSVRLRKEDSLKEKGGPIKNRTISNGSIVNKNSENNDHLQHRRNMDDVFKSIKSRKVDSFIQSESQ